MTHSYSNINFESKSQENLIKNFTIRVDFVAVLFIKIFNYAFSNDYAMNAI